LVAAADTCMTQTNAELMAEFYPDVPVRSELSDHEVLLSIT
jgi:UDP-glucose 4-epimerase